jgi:DNA-binding transcriptional MerR regulator
MKTKLTKQLELKENYFTRQDILKICNITIKQLCYLEEKNLIDAVKKAHLKLYTWHQLIEIKIISKLRENISLQKVRNAKEYLSILGETTDFRDKILIASFEQIYFIKYDDKAKIITQITGKGKGETVLFLLDMNEFLNDIDRQNIVNFETKKLQKTA